jgi:E3 ubiquitin-protein ligase HUWE1
VNKRIINKMIKAKPALFTNELDGFVRYMPNLLDFENKRSYFKKEIHKMKRSNDMYGGSVQLYIRRDDILHDAFT